MNTCQHSNFFYKVCLLILSFISFSVSAFDSGSTGGDGEFNPTTNTVLAVPEPDGIFNFTNVNIPAGVTVTFTKNAANTPVSILATGNVVINGTIDVTGGASANVNGDSDDGQPGIGGPGGFDGGRGGIFSFSGGSTGLGLGGGERGVGKANAFSRLGCAGGGGGYATAGNSPSSGTAPNQCTNSNIGVGGGTYGSARLLPVLTGGSGGGGASGGERGLGSGGGGGGGAILVSATGTVTINGEINANGGNSGSLIPLPSSTQGATGGGGSGGAIRIVASTINGSGNLTAVGGIAWSGNGAGGSQVGGNGGEGRIRLEAELLQWSQLTTPILTSGVPSPSFAPNIPSIVIASVGGIAVPAAPTGVNDVTLPDDTPNPVDVVFNTSNIPTGGTINLIATPARGSVVNATSGLIAGTEASGTATASIDLPNGPSVLVATTSFNVTASIGKDFSKYAMGEEVEKVQLSVNGEGFSETKFITVSGKEFTYPSNALAMH